MIHVRLPTPSLRRADVHLLARRSFELTHYRGRRVVAATPRAPQPREKASAWRLNGCATVSSVASSVQPPASWRSCGGRMPPRPAPWLSSVPAPCPASCSGLALGGKALEWLRTLYGAV